MRHHPVCCTSRTSSMADFLIWIFNHSTFWPSTAGLRMVVNLKSHQWTENQILFQQLQTCWHVLFLHLPMRVYNSSGRCNSEVLQVALSITQKSASFGKYRPRSHHHELVIDDFQCSGKLRHGKYAPRTILSSTQVNVSCNVCYSVL
jgi:hypothetical protein